MRAPNDRGFTLLELMIVITVMGLVLAMVVPATGKLAATHQFVGARNMLMGDMQLARTMASAQGRTYELRRSTSGYSLVCLAPSSTVLQRRLPSRVAFAAADSTTFFAWGLTEPAVIVLRSGTRAATVRMTSGGQVTHD
jgi:prepilin-type N-terminal cleavage/methylation domain-containing protein